MDTNEKLEQIAKLLLEVKQQLAESSGANIDASNSYYSSTAPLSELGTDPTIFVSDSYQSMTPFDKRAAFKISELCLPKELIRAEFHRLTAETNNHELLEQSVIAYTTGEFSSAQEKIERYRQEKRLSIETPCERSVSTGVIQGVLMVANGETTRARQYLDRLSVGIKRNFGPHSEQLITVLLARGLVRTAFRIEHPDMPCMQVAQKVLNTAVELYESTNVSTADIIGKLNKFVREAERRHIQQTFR